MGREKTSPCEVTLQEIERASVMYRAGTKAGAVCKALGWSKSLFWRVIRMCRECDDAPPFPRRNKPSELGKLVKPPAQPQPVAQPAAPPSNQVWKDALAAKGIKPSTVKARRVASIRPQDLHRMRASSLPIRSGQLG